VQEAWAKIHRQKEEATSGTSGDALSGGERKSATNLVRGGGQDGY